MICSIIAAFALTASTQPATVQQEVVLQPNGNTWVYPHAADATTDEWLRFWGNAGNSVDTPDLGNFSLSYSLIQFDVKDLPEGEITSAKLHLWQDAPFTFVEEESRQRPVEVRFVPGYFNEQNYTFHEATKYMPVRGDEGIFGTGFGTVPHEQVPYEIVIDLTTGESDFKKAVETARSGNSLILMALTSTMDPQEVAEGAIYKVFSRHAANEEYRPKLVISIAD